jgi:hypothetical protein
MGLNEINKSRFYRRNSMINLDTHVYCVNCKWFRLDDEEKPYCYYESECDIWNCEDNRPFKERPKYEERIDNKCIDI